MENTGLPDALKEHGLTGRYLVSQRPSEEYEA
jgi:hypothetical protein